MITSTLTAVTAGVAAASDGATTVSIEEIQTPTGDSQASPYQGKNVTTTGVVTGVNGNGFFIQDGTGEFSGVFVFGSADVSEGDQVEVTGLVEENYDLTRINVNGDGASVTVTGQAELPAPVSLSTAEVNQEAYEGVLVSVSELAVTATPGEHGEWAVDDGSGEVAIDDVTIGDVTAPDETGGTIEEIVGPVFFSYGAFKIQPKTLENYTAPGGDDGDDGGNVTGPTLTVLSYNDIQTAASNPTKMGRLVGAVNARTESIDNPTVVVGGGDQVSPSSLSPVSNWTVPVKTLNVLDPAVEVVGNHDLDYGFEAVEDFSAASEFPWLVANIRQTDADGGGLPGTKDYVVVERGNVSIGIVGLVDEAIKSKTAVDFDEQGYEVTDFVETGDSIATRLKAEEDVDVVIAAAHIGVPESKELAKGSDAIDLIVTGDDEVEFAPETVDGTVIMEAKARTAYLGEANLTVGDDEVVLEDGRLVSLDESSSFPINETAHDIVNESRGKYLSKVAGRTTVPLDSTFGSNYAEDTRWGNTITNAFTAKTGADVAITNAGGIRGNFVIDPGTITYDDVYTSLPFGNYLVTKEMTGEQLRELLASQVTRLDADYGGQAQLQVSGVTYEFVDRPGAEHRVTDVYVEGEPLDADGTYDVTVNSYMAGWSFGDRYGWNMSDLPTVGTDYTMYGTATVEYIEANSPISPPGVDRIRRVTRTVDSVYVSFSNRTLTVTADVPNNVTGIDVSSFRLENASSGEVIATDASVVDGSLVMTFDADAVRSLNASSDVLQLYGRYNDSYWDAKRNGFAHSKLNVEIDEFETGNWYDRYVDANGVVDAEGLNRAVREYLSGELTEPKINAVIESYLTGDPLPSLLGSQTASADASMDRVGALAA